MTATALRGRSMKPLENPVPFYRRQILGFFVAGGVMAHRVEGLMEISTGSGLRQAGVQGGLA